MKNIRSILKVEIVAVMLLFSILDRVSFVNTWSVIRWISAECDIQLFQETIHAWNQRLKCNLKVKVRNIRTT